MQTFDTPRLHLRPLGENDEALYCRLYADPILMQHIAPPMTPEAAQRSFGTALKQQGGARMLWVIEARDGGSEYGILGVVPKDDAAEVGVMLFAQAQARGFAAEVISTIADELFQASTIRRLWTRHAPANAPMSVLMRNLGFEPLTTDALPAEGRPDAEMRAGEMPAGEVRWQMTCERWARRREALATAEHSR